MDIIKSNTECFVKGLRDFLYGFLFLYRLIRKQPLGNDTESRRSSKKKKAKDEDESSILYNILQCIGLNGVTILLSMHLIYNIFIPITETIIQVTLGGSTWGGYLILWISPVLSFLFESLWLIPLFLVSKVVSTFWFNDIAEATFLRSGGHPRKQSFVWRTISDYVFSLILYTFILIQAAVCAYLPFVGQPFCMLQYSLLYSLYAFEYKWCYLGWELHKRISYVEKNWPYFMGFSSGVVFISSFAPSTVVNSSIVSILFPLLIISANFAEPMEATNQKSIPLFHFVVGISNAIFSWVFRKKFNVSDPAKSSRS